MTIRWARSAVRQLEAAREFIAADNPKAADQVLLQIVESVGQLSGHPRMGREGRVKDTRELVILNTPFIIAYRIKDEKSIEVLAVLHGKRRWPEEF
jgi:toxin ParE1/3/4